MTGLLVLTVIYTGRPETSLEVWKHDVTALGSGERREAGMAISSLFEVTEELSGPGSHQYKTRKGKHLLDQNFLVFTYMEPVWNLK